MTLVNVSPFAFASTVARTPYRWAIAMNPSPGWTVCTSVGAGVERRFGASRAGADLPGTRSRCPGTIVLCSVRPFARASDAGFTP